MRDLILSVRDFQPLFGCEFLDLVIVGLDLSDDGFAVHIPIPRLDDGHGRRARPTQAAHSTASVDVIDKPPMARALGATLPVPNAALFPNEGL